MHDAMNSSTELIHELHQRFEATKKELGFKATFEEIDSIFFISDSILNAGFVSTSFSRQLCSRIVDTYMSWNNYLHNLFMPQPMYMIHMNESKMFNDEEKRGILKIIAQAMEVVSVNTLVGLTKDKKAEGKFIDQAVAFWDATFKPKLAEIVQKVHDGWKK